MYKKVDRIGEVDGRKLVVLWNLIEVVVWWFEKVLGGGGGSEPHQKILGAEDVKGERQLKSRSQ